MKKDLTNEIFLQITAVIIAVFVWFVIIYTKNPVIEVTIKNIPVEFLGEDALEENNLCVLNPEKPLTASVVLRGTRGDLFGVIDKITATIDVSGINTPGEIEKDVDFYQPDRAVEIVRNNRASAGIIIDKTAEKDIPVLINYSGVNKTYLVSSRAVPDTIHVKGAESEIGKIDKAYVDVDIASMSGDNDTAAGYYFADFLGNEIDESSICNVKTNFDLISVSNRLFRKKIVNINVVYPKSLTDKYDIQTKSVSDSECVVGIYGDGYESLKSVNFEAPETLSAGSNQKFTLTAPEMENMIFEHGDEITAAADIEPKKEIYKTVMIDFAGITRDKIDTQQKTVTLKLMTTDRRLENSTVTASVDLSGYTPGEYTDIPIIINAPEEITVDGTYKINFLTIN